MTTVSQGGVKNLFSILTTLNMQRPGICRAMHMDYKWQRVYSVSLQLDPPLGGFTMPPRIQLDLDSTVIKFPGKKRLMMICVSEKYI